MPDTTGLVGDANLIWVVGFLLALLTVTNIYWIRRDGKWEEKYDKLSDKLLRMALRSQKAIEALADIEVEDEES